MGLLILALIFVTIALTIFAFGSSHKADSPPEPEKSLTLKQDQINSLKTELEKLSLNYQNLQNELTLAKNRESDLKKELERFKGWDNREQTDLEKIKKENTQLKDDLVVKEKEIEQGFATNLNLDKELKEHREKSALLDKEKKEMSDEMRLLQAKISGLQKEIDTQNKLIWEMKKKNEESEWVSKQEYNQLKIQLAAKEQEFKKLQNP